ncbi:MAG TPA: hypothetical protein VIR60_08920 [Gammaproteobacteria bacterium]
MAISTHRGKMKTLAPNLHAVSAPLPESPERQAHIPVAEGLFAEDILLQVQSLGLSHADAVKLLKAARHALCKALDGLDSHAWMAASAVQQISMLLPRLDIGRLARGCRLAKADVQSALALLVMDFVNLSQQARH